MIILSGSIVVLPYVVLREPIMRKMVFNQKGTEKSWMDSEPEYGVESGHLEGEAQ